MPSRSILAASTGLIAALALLATAAQSPAYSTLGTKWSKGKVTYYNGVKAYDPAVKAAVSAWNKSGAKVKFKRVSKKKARVQIRYLPDSTCRGLTRLPRVKRTRSATVYLPSPTAPEYCRDHFTTTIIAAHELGHVLGLGHESRRCALMNPNGNRTGGSLCVEIGGTPPWLWRCRVLEPDDVRGAIKIYGGKYRSSKFTASPLCETYAEPPPPSLISATDSSDRIQISVQRPADAPVPTFVSSQFPSGTPFLYAAYAAGTACPPASSAKAYGWKVAPGGVDTGDVSPVLTPGTYCVSVWATDAVGRPSAPRTQLVNIS